MSLEHSAAHALETVTKTAAAAFLRLAQPLELPENGSSTPPQATSPPSFAASDNLPTAYKRKHSVGDRAATVPILRLLSWILLFVILSLCTAVLLNWFLRRRQQQADDHADNPPEEEMRLTSGDGVTTGATTTAIPVSDKAKSTSDPPSSASLGVSSGNSSRQRFLETRRAAAQRTYGTTEEPNAETRPNH